MILGLSHLTWRNEPLPVNGNVYVHQHEQLKNRVAKYTRLSSKIRLINLINWRELTLIKLLFPRSSAKLYYMLCESVANDKYFLYLSPFSIVSLFDAVIFPSLFVVLICLRLRHETERKKVKFKKVLLVLCESW